MPYKKFYEKSTDYYNNIFVNDVEILYADYFDCFFSFILCTINFVVYSLCALFISYIVALVIICSSIFTLFIPQFVGKKLSSKRNEQTEANEEYMSSLKDLLGGYSLNNHFTNEKINGVHYLYNSKKERTLYNFNKYRSFVDIFGGASLYIVNILTFIAGILLINY